LTLLTSTAAASGRIFSIAMASALFLSVRGNCGDDMQLCRSLLLRYSELSSSSTNRLPVPVAIYHAAHVAYTTSLPQWTKERSTPQYGSYARVQGHPSQIITKWQTSIRGRLLLLYYTSSAAMSPIKGLFFVYLTLLTGVAAAPKKTKFNWHDIKYM